MWSAPEIRGGWAEVNDPTMPPRQLLPQSRIFLKEEHWSGAALFTSTGQQDEQKHEDIEDPVDRGRHAPGAQGHPCPSPQAEAPGLQGE